MSEPIQGTVIPNFDAKDVEENKLLACLSYLSILCLVPLLGARNSRFAQEHAKQGLILCVVWIVGSFIFWIPLFGWAATVIVFIANLVALVRCVEGSFWEIPYIGKYRDKIKM
jgi:uncharacterized membrane protein